jgi:uncharacterized protein
MQFQQAKAFILEKLKKELPGYLFYHSVDHIIDVYQAAENIGISEHINEHDMKLLLTAALFHDAGFINGSDNHEQESCRIADRYLKQYDYTGDEIESIKGMIMATKIPQSPKNHLEEIICDADLDYLGRDDFFRISHKLYLEFANAGIVHNENDWDKLQAAFFEKHHFFTKTALKLRQKKKEEHLSSIRSKIN